MTDAVWIDDRLLAHGESATISLFDHGVTVGDGVFETMKTVRREPFAITRHLRRLRFSAAGLGLEVARTDDEFRAAVSAVIDAVPGHDEVRVRVTVTGGAGPAGSGRGDAAPTMFVTGAPLAASPPSSKAITVRWRRNEHSAVAGLKTTSYAENVVALAEATEAGATEALFSNTAGQLCEGTGSNVFIVIDRSVLTPPLTSGCLAGITRALVLEMGGVEERELPFTVLSEADEVFLTSSTRDVQAITAVDGKDVGDGKVGPTTTAFQRRWSRLEASTTDP